MTTFNKYGFSDDGYKSTELIKTTQDDWKPNLENNKIKVRVSIRPNVTNQFYTVYICAIGASKYRLELLYETTIKKLADEKYEFWVKFIQNLPREVNKSMFIEVGMQEKEI